MQEHVVIGNILREARLKKGMTQSELAKKLGHQTPQFVSFFERGISKCPVETLGKLTIILNIKPDRVVKTLSLAHQSSIELAIAKGRKIAKDEKL